MRDGHNSGDRHYQPGGERDDALSGLRDRCDRHRSQVNVGIVVLALDAQVQAGLTPLLAPLAEVEPPQVGDVDERRRNGHRLFDQVAEARTPIGGVDVERHALTAYDGATLNLSWYQRSTGEKPGSAVLYLHGGGMIMGLQHLGHMYDIVVRDYVAMSGVPMLVVDYRVAPEHPHPTPVEDCYAALRWLAERAAALGVDPARLAVMGDSAGGGLAAGVSLLARDRRGPTLAQQLLIYPMLDDRTTTPDPQLASLPFLIWTYDDNVTGWAALLGDSAGTGAVSPYAAPARADDLTGLPDAYIDVGDLDIFRDEDVTYARRLADAGIPTELHVHPGCPHGFELVASEADVSRRAIGDRIRRLRAL
jgi:acetyl esterase/lipase